MNKESSFRNLKIGFIGAGRIAHSLVPALIEKSLPVDIIISRQKKSALLLADSNRIKKYSNKIQDILGCNLIFLTITDDEISKTALDISTLADDFSGKIFIHLSGAKTINELGVLANKGASTASLHIMQSFPLKNRVNLNNQFAAIEAKQDALFRFIRNLAEVLGLRPFRITSELKIYYHLAGVFASNFLVANSVSINKCLAKTGITEFPGSDISYPISIATLNNIKDKGTENALSGPLLRGDILTVKSHIEAISDPLMKLNYLSSSLSIMEILSGKPGYDVKLFGKIKNMLIDELKKIISKL